MTGKTHKALGVAVAAAAAIYAVETGNTVVAVSAATAPFGAMLPDMDHHATELGRVKSEVDAILVTVAAVVGLGVLALCVWLAVSSENGLADVPSLLLSVLPVCGLILLVRSDFVKRRFPFFYKHRGIMHTLFVPGLLWVGASNIDEPVTKYLILGLMLGYISHLVSDTMTVSGTPLAWPLTEQNISLGRVVTNTPGEYVMAALLGVCTIAYGHTLAQDGSKIYYLLVFFACAVGNVLPDVIGRMFRGSKPFVNSMIFPLGVLVIGLVLTLLEMVIGYLLIGLSVGMIVRKLTIMSRKRKR